MKFERLNIEIDLKAGVTLKAQEERWYVDLMLGAQVKFRVYRNSTVKAYSNSTVEAYSNSTVEAYSNSTVEAYSNSTVKAYSNSTVKAWDNSTVKAWDNSTVEAYSNSTVKAWDNSTVKAYSNSTVEAFGFSFVRRLSSNTTIKKLSAFVTEVSAIRKFKKATPVYKKVRSGDTDIIAELECAKGQVFQSQNGSKCRTAEAKVITFYDLEHNELKHTEARSLADRTFLYRVGEVVNTNYDTDIEECSEGIHFYLTFDEAVNHRY